MIYLASDWHFGHEKLIELEARPGGFDLLIFQRLVRTLKRGDLLIFLGDAYLYDKGRKWMKTVMEAFDLHGIRCATIIGNHDPASIEAALTMGWCFACTKFTLKYNGKTIVFTHEPLEDFVQDINIHGHLHTMGGHGSRGPLIRDRRHILISSELCDYRPVPLERVIQIGTPKWHGGKFSAADDTFKPKAPRPPAEVGP